MPHFNPSTRAEPANKPNSAAHAPSEGRVVLRTSPKSALFPRVTTASGWPSPQLSPTCKSHLPEAHASLMAPEDVPQDAVALRLDYLLQRARVVKPGTGVDPPLQVSELVPGDQSLLGSIEGDKDVRSLAVDSPAKHLFYAILVCQTSASSNISLTRPGNNSNSRARVCEYLELARHRAVLRRQR